MIRKVHAFLNRLCKNAGSLLDEFGGVKCRCLWGNWRARIGFG